MTYYVIEKNMKYLKILRHNQLQSIHYMLCHSPFNNSPIILSDHIHYIYVV